MALDQYTDCGYARESDQIAGKPPQVLEPQRGQAEPADCGERSKQRKALLAQRELTHVHDPADVEQQTCNREGQEQARGGHEQAGAPRAHEGALIATEPDPREDQGYDTESVDL